jgi:hypothetical protein
MVKALILFCCAVALLSFSSCEKAQDIISPETGKNVVLSTFKAYTIRKGQHYCDQNLFSMISVNKAMKFNVRFDQSAFYSTEAPVNQYDINKLWGFSEGLDHQYNSARMGWAYNEGALRLYGYVYVNGVRHSAEVATVQTGVENACSIELMGSTYVFTVNGSKLSLPRAACTPNTSGYKLYPYFGGDEVAPQDIKIEIKELN